MIKQLLRTAALGTFLFAAFNSSGQCVDTNNIYSFTYNGTDYEVVRENKTWTEASTCAVERGGYLAEINDQAEQTAVYDEVFDNAGITASNTVAPDGGGASYVWIGGNDFATEGRWIWDGDNNTVGPQFWQGTSTGVPIGGLFNNWGNEPDDFGTGQDGLGLAITNWPLGLSGEWNDVDDANTLYYVIEISNTNGINESSLEQSIEVSPVPFDNTLTVNFKEELDIESIVLLNVSGQIILNYINSSFDTETLTSGVYFVHVTLSNGDVVVKKVVK